MTVLRIVIADDERPAREFLKSLLRDFADIEIVGEAENGADAVELIKDTRPDLALLDLQMPEMSGIEAVKTLRKSQMPVVAFVTAFDNYAVQAFELNAVDYLLKPVEKQRLGETLRRAAERLEQADWRETETEKIRNATSIYEESSGSG
ncbi:MAG TPA: response regulator, partial [Pyrinomonadaceae bacterium]|nr:response regulator [Pyrinomonadaceae bacterium]